MICSCYAFSHPMPAEQGSTDGANLSVLAVLN
jgi:hypothetical protein